MKILNLFSIFDPSSSILNLNWLMIILPAVMAPLFNNNKIIKMMMSFSMKLKKEIFQSSSKMKGSLWFISSWFMMILWLNYSSMISFSFTVTAQISMCFSMSMMVWLSIFSKNWLKQTKKSMAHLVPSGSPAPLMPILTLIELTSSIIRPITLSVRLTANMMAGHLMMSLLMEKIQMTNLIFTLPSAMILTTLELAVSAIQAYVFTILITLYSAEIYKVKFWFPIK